MDSSGYLVSSIFIILFILSIIVVIGKHIKNKALVNKKDVFENYKFLQVGLTKKEVKTLFKNLKPSSESNEKIAYTHRFKLRGIPDIQVERVEVFFKNNQLQRWSKYSTLPNQYETNLNQHL